MMPYNSYIFTKIQTQNLKKSGYTMAGWHQEQVNPFNGFK